MTQFSSNIVQRSDFTGNVFLSLSSAQDQTPYLDAAISEIQEDYLKDLMGISLYLKFAALYPNNLTQKFTDLLNGTTYADPQRYNEYNKPLQVDYIGLKKMLVHFTWWYYVTRQTGINAVAGMVKNGAIASNQFSTIEVSKNASMKYNVGIELYGQAQKFIRDANMSSATSTTVINNGDGTFTANFSAAIKYIEVGDNINANGAAYAVTSVTSTSVTFTATGSFENNTAFTWMPFEDYDGKKKSLMVMGGYVL